MSVLCCNDCPEKVSKDEIRKLNKRRPTLAMTLLASDDVFAGHIPL